MLVPDPAMAPGFIVQLPVGKPFKITLPVAKVQEGWVIVPAVGADGVAGCRLITTLADTGDVHPTELVTVNVRVPEASPERVALLPVPVIDSGFIVQFPDGNPLSITLPVATVHVGCETVPIVGADGVAG